MGGITFDGLRTLVRKLTFEKVGDEGLFEGNLDQFINIAYKSVFTAIVAENPDYFSTPSPDVTFTSAGLAFSAIGSTGAYDVTGVDIKDSSGTYRPLRKPSRRAEVGIYHGVNEQVTAADLIQTWFVENEVIFLVPEPASSFTGRVWNVPIPADLSLNGDYPFGGMLPLFHDVIALECAINMLDKDSSPSVLVRTHERRWGLLMKHIRRVQAAAPRRQHRTETEDYE